MSLSPAPLGQRHIDPRGIGEHKRRVKIGAHPRKLQALRIAGRQGQQGREVRGHRDRRRHDLPTFEAEWTGISSFFFVWFFEMDFV